MTIGTFAVSSVEAAVFDTNGNRVGKQIAHITLEPVLVLDVWENPRKHDLSDEGRKQFCDMYLVLTSVGLGWMNEEEVRLVNP
jgi:hypothetical protein